jgi:hypothetical protein
MPRPPATTLSPHANGDIGDIFERGSRCASSFEGDTSRTKKLCPQLREETDQFSIVSYGPTGFHELKKTPNCSETVQMRSLAEIQPTAGNRREKSEGYIKPVIRSCAGTRGDRAGFEKGVLCCEFGYVLGLIEYSSAGL